MTARTERAETKAWAAAYQAVINLAHMNHHLASELADMASTEAREKYEEDLEVFSKWMSEYVKIQGMFFQGNLQGSDGVDTYMTIEAHVSAYNAFHLEITAARETEGNPEGENP